MNMIRGIKWKTVGVFSAVMATAMTAGTAAQAADLQWRVVKTTNYSNYDAFNSVVALSRKDAWAFGAKQAAFNLGPVALHWTGSAWNTVALPTGITGEPTASDASSGSNVWVAGSENGIAPYALRWNGTAWSVAKTWPVEGQITGVVALGPADVWVFGAPGRNRGLGTWHFDGAQWSQFPLDFFPGRASAVSANDIWAIGRGATGDSRLLAHYGGTTWEPVDLGDLLPPDVHEGDTFYQYVSFSDIEVLSAGDVWITGVVNRSEGGTHTVSPFLLHGDGQAWQKIDAPGSWSPGRLEPDGAGGLWLEGTTQENRPVTMRRTANGVWSTVGVAAGDRVGNVMEMALVPSTRTLWGVGDVRPGDNSGGDGAIFVYGKLPIAPYGIRWPGIIPVTK